MRNIKKHIESLWKYNADVYVYRKVKNLETKITKDMEELVYEDVPCRISFKNSSNILEEINVPTAQFIAKLICSNKYDIKAGSKIVVRMLGSVKIFRSSIPMFYTYHQEIELQEYKGKGEV